MFALFFVALLVCIVGLIRPFANLRRKHYAWGAAGAFVLMLVTAPASDSNPPAGSAERSTISPAEAQQLEKKNSAEIAKLKKEAASIRATNVDENLRIYTRLAEMAPANTDFASKRSKFQAAADARERYADHPEEALTIANVDWSKGGFGSIMMIDRMAVRNDAPFPIKDFVVKCVHQGPSGTDMDSNTRTVYEIVPANASKTVHEVNMGFINSQVATSRCEITDAVSG